MEISGQLPLSEITHVHAPVQSSQHAFGGLHGGSQKQPSALSIDPEEKKACC